MNPAFLWHLGTTLEAFRGGGLPAFNNLPSAQQLQLSMQRQKELAG
jgi:hypothetical protein